MDWQISFILRATSKQLRTVPKVPEKAKSQPGGTVLWLITGVGIQGWSSSIWARYLSPSEITSTDPWGPDVLCSLRMTNSVVQYDLGMGLLVNDML